MLNNFKKIKNNKNCDHTFPVFWKIPTWPKASFQKKLEQNTVFFLQGLPILCTKPQQNKSIWWKKKKRRKLKFLKLRFFFYSFGFNSIFLFKKFSKQKKKINLKLKKNILLIDYLFKRKKQFKSYMIRSKKGGFFVTAFGFKSFMPHSHSKLLLKNSVSDIKLIGLNSFQNRKRFSKQKQLFFNVISSTKQLIK